MVSILRMLSSSGIVPLSNFPFLKHLAAASAFRHIPYAVGTGTCLVFGLELLLLGMMV